MGDDQNRQMQVPLVSERISIDVMTFYPAQYPMHVRIITPIASTDTHYQAVVRVDIVEANPLVLNKGTLDTSVPISRRGICGNNGNSIVTVRQFTKLNTNANNHGEVKTSNSTPLKNSRRIPDINEIVYHLIR